METNGNNLEWEKGFLAALELLKDKAWAIKPENVKWALINTINAVYEENEKDVRGT